MKYKNRRVKSRGNFRPQEVSCAYCKTPVVIYHKGGNGGLIKMQLHRIIEAEVDVGVLESTITCPKCGEILAKLGVYNGKPAYWIVRGQVNTRWLKNYKL